MNGARLGTGIVSTGGLAFIAFNASGLPAALGWLLTAAGVLLFLATMRHSVLTVQRGAGRPRPDAFRTYWVAVALMLVAFLVGTQLLVRVIHASYLVPLWIAFVVGAHFLPFRRAFGAAVFGALGVLMMVVCATGAVLAAALGDVWASAGAVAVGFVMLGCMYAGPDFSLGRTSPRPLRAHPSR